MSVEIIKCFIASPGDTAKERDICVKVLNEINQALGKIYNFRLEALKWENDSRPSFGEYSQAVISSQLGNDYNVFIGIMHQKFGTETKVAGSGTEEEFYNAYNRFVKDKDVEIMFYFNDAAPEKLSDINIEQLEKVNSFKNKLASLGGYYWSYNGAGTFEAVLRNHLNSFVISKFGSSNSNVDLSALKKKQ